MRLRSALTAVLFWGSSSLPVRAQEGPEGAGPQAFQPSSALDRASSSLSLSPAETNETSVAPALTRPPPPPREAELVSGKSNGMAEAASIEAANSTRGVRNHDGFYLRMALGANYGRAFVQTNRRSTPDLRITGMGRALDIWAGRTVPPGFVIGVKLGIADISSEAAEIGSESSPGEAVGVHAGGFLDAYPNPREGYHFGGSLTLTALKADARDGDTDFLGAGLGFAAFAGYDAWIGPQLAVGGLLRLGGAVTRTAGTNEADILEQGVTYSAQLLATLVYH